MQAVHARERPTRDSEWIQILLRSRRVAPAFSLSMSYPLSLEYMSLRSFFLFFN